MPTKITAGPIREIVAESKRPKVLALGKYNAPMTANGIAQVTDLGRAFRKYHHQGLTPHS
jgi:hypothetical protein